MIDPKTLTRNWNYPTSVRFGPGRIAQGVVDIVLHQQPIVGDDGRIDRNAGGKADNLRRVGIEIVGKGRIALVHEQGHGQIALLHPRGRAARGEARDVADAARAVV